MRQVESNLIIRRRVLILVLFAGFIVSASLLFPARAKVAKANSEVEQSAPPAGSRFHMVSDKAKSSSQATQAKAPAQTEGCVTCHKGAEDPHPDGQVNSCVACHGGDPAATTKDKAHPKPKYPQSWPSSANPEESYILLNRESKDWIRFVNPSDLRVVEISCGKCHEDLIKSVKKYTMTTSYQVYSTALYNNGTLPWKNAVLGESYTDSGKPQAMRTIPPPTEEETRTKGILPIIFTFPRFEIGQPGDLFRPFERGGGPKSELGNPDRQDIPGQPDVTLSNRGYGTQAAVDPVIIGAHKIRLNDPVMSFLGTNNAPGDYRTSGCGSCHIVYANDRSTFNSGPWAKYGNTGHSFSDDPTIPKDQPGHPIQHKFTRSIPSSQCITCHVHNGNGFLNTYLGYMWWDEETDGEFLYPQKQHNPTQKEIDKAGRFNPEEAAARGLWKDSKFLETVSDLNPQMHKMQVSDYHGHGWMFRRVYKQDRKGNYLTADDQKIDFNDPDLFKKAVHLQDIHLEKGMHCVDCHFNQDAHGNDKIYGDRRAAIEISCEDCHGSLTKKITKLTDLKTSGFGAPDGGNKINERTPFGQTRFVLRNGKLFQRSMLEQGKEWEVIQVQDTVTPGNEHYNEKSAAAKTMMKDGATWGNASADPNQLAHSEAKVSCVACHSSWVTNCFGCHLAASVNTKKPLLHMEGDADETQVYASYNPQVLRTDGYMLGIDGSVQGHKVMPVRSSSVVSFSVRNNTRGWIINHVPTISAAGYNGNAFNTHPPHTVRAKETKQCTDCHVSANNDNNSWLAGVTMVGTNQVNFMGKYIYMAEGKGGLSATRVTEDDQPEAVFGSHLHKIAYPDNYKEFVANKGLLSESHSHRTYESNQVQMYSEYLLSAAGKHGFIVYDIANVANKDFSQRIVTAPFSPLGQGLYVRTKNATGIAVGSPIPLDPKRVQLPVNEEQPVAKLFGYAFISDSVEGLVTVDITTLEDGAPTNNFLKRGATYNPDGKLTGARSIKVVGNYVYICTDHGLEIVNISDPMSPRFVGEVGAPLRDPRNVAVQFRYAFVTDADGLKVLDITDIEHPVATSAVVPLKDAQGLYLSRTYAYVADGADGLAIVDIERPDQAKLDQMFNAGGTMNDTRDVKTGMVNVSLFAFVADGKNGLKVVELMSPETVPGNLGYSPRPNPRQVSYYPTKSPAITVSEGYRRDRAVDESGNQISVFGRRGARPFNLEEMRRLYIRDGKLYTVTDEPPRRTSSNFLKGSGVAVSWFGLMALILPLSFLFRSRRRY